MLAWAYVRAPTRGAYRCKQAPVQKEAANAFGDNFCARVAHEVPGAKNQFEVRQPHVEARADELVLLADCRGAPPTVKFWLYCRTSRWRAACAGRSDRAGWWPVPAPVHAAAPRTAPAPRPPARGRARPVGVRSAGPGGEQDRVPRAPGLERKPGARTLTHGCCVEGAITWRKRSGWRAASSRLVKRPQSWPARSLRSTPSASSSAIRPKLTRRARSAGRARRSSRSRAGRARSAGGYRL